MVKNDFNLNKQNRTLTYGKFKLTEAYKQLFNSIRQGWESKAQLWSVQINISYEFNTLFKKLVDFYFAEINICNPKVIHLIYSDNLIYNLEVLKQYQTNKDITSNYHNHQIIRNHLCQFVSILTQSNKKKLPKLIKITEAMLNFQATASYIKFRNNNISEMVMKKDDDINLTVPINEILNILQKGDKQFASETHLLFWLNWIYTYDKVYNSKKYTKHNSRRYVNELVNEKYVTDVSWLIWQIIMYFGKKLTNNNILQKMLYIYCEDFKPSQKTKKKNIVIMAFLLILNTNNRNYLEYPLFTNYQVTAQAILNINPLYEKIKNI